MTSAPHEEIPLPKQSPPENSNFTAPTYTFKNLTHPPHFQGKLHPYGQSVKKSLD